MLFWKFPAYIKFVYTTLVPFYNGENFKFLNLIFNSFRIEHLQMDDKSLKSSSSFYSSGSSYPDYESSYNTSPQSESPSTSQRFMIFSKAKCKSCVKKRFFKICQKCGSSVLIKRNVSAARKYQPNDSTSES